MVKVICDKCGAEITKDPIRLNMTYVDVMTENIEGPITSREQEKREYCENCAKAILRFAEKPEVLRFEYKATEKNEALEKEEPEKQDNQGKRTKIDIGKVMALKNTGWSAAKIADEMGTTAQKIYSAVHYHKKKMQDIEARRLQS